MCGIIGYVGSRASKDLLITGLERLEFRGYDSAGIALLEDGGLEYVRAVGNLQNLKRAAGHPGRNPHALEARFLVRVIAAHPERVARVSRKRAKWSNGVMGEWISITPARHYSIPLILVEFSLDQIFDFLHRLVSVRAIATNQQL